MPRREPTYDTFRQELELVVARHAELVNETPGFMAAMLLHEADALLAKHNIAVERIEEDGGVSGAYGIKFDDGAGAMLGIAHQPERASELESEFAMVDDRAGEVHMIGGGR